MTFAKKRYNSLLAVLVLFIACERPALKEAELTSGVIIEKTEGFLLSPHPRGGYELAPEIGGGKIEKASYSHFEPQELRLPMDSVGTQAFADSLLKVYGLTLKRNMGAFGAMMKSYLEYFDKFEIVALSSVERNGKTWQLLLKKHNEENHYWQSFYTTHKGNLIFITLFYTLEAEERAIPTTELFKYLDAVRFNAERSNAQ